MTPSYRTRSAETWDLARDDYLSGLSAEAVCRRHDLGLSAFRQRARRYRWRRLDQPEPAPGDRGPDLDLSIYEDIDADDQVRTARLRFVQALERGGAVEAARWRRLWQELRVEVQAYDGEMFPGLTPTEIAVLLAAETAADDTDEDLRRLSDE